MIRRVLVTGASGGIGEAIARSLAQAGFAVTAHYRSNQAKAEQLFDELKDLNVDSRLISFDVANREEVHKVLADELEQCGPFYGVVSNAGVTRDGLFPAMKDADWDDVININLNSFFNVVQPLVMPMVRLKNSGRIIVISSVSGLVGNAGQVNYSASKAGLIGATRSLAQELARKRITVNCIAPGLIKTEMTADLPSAEIIKHIPMRRMGTADEVSALASFLMSDAAGYITGQTISINGGLV